MPRGRLRAYPPRKGLWDRWGCPRALWDTGGGAARPSAGLEGSRPSALWDIGGARPSVGLEASGPSALWDADGRA